VDGSEKLLANNFSLRARAPVTLPSPFFRRFTRFPRLLRKRSRSPRSYDYLESPPNISYDREDTALHF